MLLLLADAVTSSEATMQGYEGAFFKMFLTLIGLLVAIFFTVWILRRFAQGRSGQWGGSRAIKVVERKPISPKTILYLVELEGKRVLIAESQLEVKRLLDLDELPESPPEE